MAAVQLPVEHDSRAQSGSDEQERKVGNSLGDSVSLFSDGGEVDVVLQPHRHAKRPLELLAQVAGAEPREVGRGHLSVDRRNDGGQGDDGVLEQVGRELARPQQRTAAAREHVDPLRDRASAADLLPGPHLAVQVAEGGAHGARPEVDTEDDGGFGLGLEVGGAVVRPLGVVLGLPDEPVLEQRAKDERHGRPGDAGLRTASSTVRSFNARSSAGTALVSVTS